MPSSGPFYFNIGTDLGTVSGGVNAPWVDPQDIENGPDNLYTECNLLQIGSSGNWISNILGVYSWKEISPIPINDIIQDIIISLYGFIPQGNALSVNANFFGYNNGLSINHISQPFNLEGSNWTTDLSILSAFDSKPTPNDINNGKVGFGVYFTASSIQKVELDSARMTVVYQGQPSKQIVSNKYEVVPALPWMLEDRIPKVRLRKKSRQYFPIGKPVYLQSKTISRNFSGPALDLKLNKNSETITRSFDSVNEIFQRKLSSVVTTQSESVRGSFYFATIVNLHGAAISQSFAYSNSAPVLSVVQLKSTGLCVSQGYSNGFIEYLNLKGAGFSQAYISETSKAKKIALQSESKSRNFGSANVQHPYELLVELTSEVLTVSRNLAAITRSGIGLTSQVISVSPSYGSELITRPFHSNMLSSSVDKSSEAVIRKLSSEQITISNISITENLKKGLSSKLYTQTTAHAQEIVARSISASAKSFGLVNTEYLVKQNKSSLIIGVSSSRSGETVTRVLSGIADSISIAQKTNGKINRLFVSSSLAWSSGKAIGGFINKGMYSAMYSQTYVYNHGGVGIRNFASKSATYNPFRAASSLKQNKSSEAITCSESNSNEKVIRKLSSEALMQSELVPLVSIKKLFVGAGLSNSLSSTHEQIRLGLSSKVYTQTDSHGQEIVSRLLATKSSSVEYVLSQPKVLQNKASKAVSQSEISSNEHVNRKLNSETITVSESFAEPSVQKLVNSKAVFSSYSSTISYIKKNLASKSVLVTENNSNIKVNRVLQSQSILAGFTHSEPYHSLIELYGFAISESNARSDLFEKLISLQSESVDSSNASGTEGYLGSKFEVISRGDLITSQEVINLAPFNYPDDVTPYTE